jgi:hypothetical protein
MPVMSPTVTQSQASMSTESLARLGTNNLAYVTKVRSEQAGFIHAEAPLLPPGRQVFVLHAADGHPLAIAASLDAIMAEAASHSLETVSVH